MAKVVFRPSGKTIECEVGDNLLEVARRADVFIEAPCNGSKSCGKCKVKLLTGEVNQEVSSHLTDEDKANGYILACCTTIIGDIEVLTNSSLDMAMRGMKVEGGDKAKDKALFDKAVEIAENHNIKLENNIKKTCITLDEPTLDDNISDVDRLERHISMNFGKQMTYDIEVLKVIPKAFRKNNFEITITYREFDDRLEIIDVEPGNTESELYGLAIDIGTTSVVVCLVNMITNEVVAYGVSCDAYHITSPHSDGMCAAKAIEDAIKEAKIDKTDISYINAHGTSTYYNDLYETRAIKNVFEDYAKNIPISSTKSMIGHLLGAAGAVESIACIKSLQDDFIHPTIGYTQSEEELDLDYVPNKGRKENLKYVLNNSLGFGGHNACLIFKKWE